MRGSSMNIQLVVSATLMFTACTFVVGRPKDMRSCDHNGIEYQHGEQITQDNCTYVCTCDTKYPSFPTFFCEPLCTRFIDTVCSQGFTETHVMLDAGPPGSGCQCPKEKCVPDVIGAGFKIVDNTDQCRLSCNMSYRNTNTISRTKSFSKDYHYNSNIQQSHKYTLQIKLLPVRQGNKGRKKRSQQL